MSAALTQHVARPYGAKSRSCFESLALVADRIAKRTESISWPSTKWQDDPVGFAHDVLKVDLWDAQIGIIESIRDNRNTTVRSGHKALADDTPIYTPDGWRRHGDLEVGDRVFAPDGTETEITRTFPFEPRTMFRITFEDGTHIDADAEHEWIVHSRESRKRTYKSAQRRTTKELLEKIDVPNGPVRVSNWTIDLTAPIKGEHQDLPLDPYLLGLWLGDGSSVGGGYTGVDGLEQAFACAGFEVSARKPQHFFVRGLSPILRRMGVLGNKHVPAHYLNASSLQRLALLQGLLDSDGTCGERGLVEFMNTNRALADAVLFLARSLGIKARIKEKRATLYGKDCGPCWRVMWCSPMQVFRLPRKAARIRTSWVHKVSAHRRIAITSIRELPSKKSCQCIRVAHRSHMYLAGSSMVPTSNCGKSTALAVAALWFYCSFPDARVFLTAVTTPQIDKVIYREIRRLHAKSKKSVPVDGTLFELARTGLRAPDERQIWGMTARDGESLAGISGANILILADEASGIQDRFFETLGSSLAGSGGTVRKCYISNPTRTTGEFYLSHTRNAALYNCIHISSEDTPNARGEKPIPGLAGREWIEEKRQEYGEDSPQFRIRVKGEFVHDKDGKIISLDLLAQATQGWDEAPETGDLQIGIDPAGDGILGDETAIAVRRGSKILSVIAWRGIREDDIVAHALAMLDHHRHPNEAPPRIAIDAEGGIGTRVAAKLAAHSDMNRSAFELVPVRSGKKKWGDPEYDKIRDALWGQTQKWLMAGGSLPDDVKLTQELNAPSFTADANMRYVATDKKELRKILGRSTDRADAVCLSVWGFSSVDSAGSDEPSPDVGTLAKDTWGDEDGASIDPYKIDGGGW